MKKNPTPGPAMIVVAAALVDAHARILLQRRAPDRAMAGLWEFPGGKVEEGETPETALVRELEEELGIEVSSADLQPAFFASARNGERQMILLLYLCRAWRGEPRALDASELDWMTAQAMDPEIMPPADRPLVGWLRHMALSEGGRGGGPRPG